jgi:hypothetical protein
MPDYFCCAWCLIPSASSVTPCTNCGSAAMPIVVHSKLALPEFTRLNADLDRHGEHRAKLIDRWIHTFFLSAQALIDRERQPSVADVALFWIKLHGVVAELPQTTKNLHGMFESMPPAELAEFSTRSPHAAKCIALSMVVQRCVVALRDLLTPDEHIYAEWRRHQEVHLHQTAYMLQLRDKGQALKDAFEVKALGRPIAVDEQWAAIARIAAQHGGADTAVAIAFARKLGPSSIALSLAQSEFTAVAGLPMSP